MILAISGFLIAVYLPLFVSSWRIAFLGFGFQALCVALVLESHHQALYLSGALQLVDLVALRFIAVPTFFILYFSKRRRGVEFDVIPPSLVSWIAAIGLLILAVSLGQRLYPNDLVPAFHAGAVASALLSGLFILAVQKEPMGQIIGILYIESGISLFETMNHEEPWFVQLGISLTFIGLLILFFKFLNKFQQNSEDSVTEHGPELEVL